MVIPDKTDYQMLLYRQPKENIVWVIADYLYPRSMPLITCSPLPKP